jgi:Terminase-like family.
VIIKQEKVFEEIGYSPHDAQWAMHNSPARFKIACCGIRFGKSVAGARDLTVAMFKPDARYWIVGPTYALGEKEFRVVHDDLIVKMGLGSKCRVNYNVEAGNMSIHIKPWRTTVEVKSAERPKGLKGEALDGVLLAEAAELPRVIWEGYVRARLSDRKGWMRGYSTPKGFNWFYDMWVRGQDPNFDNWESWAWPSYANDIIFPGGKDDDEIEDMRKGMSPMLFDQEVLGQFTTFEGKIYDDFDEAKHVKPIHYAPAWRNFWAFDFGFANPTVCLDIMVDSMDNVYVWREYYERHKDIAQHVEALQKRENPPDWHCDAMFGDPAAAGEMAYMARTIGMVFSEKSDWGEGINEVKTLLKLGDNGQPRLFIDTSCRNLIREMHALRLETSPRIMNEKNAKEGQHKYEDHACDALRYFAVHYFLLGAGSKLTVDLVTAGQGHPSTIFTQPEWSRPGARF